MRRVTDEDIHRSAMNSVKSRVCGRCLRMWWRSSNRAITHKRRRDKHKAVDRRREIDNEKELWDETREGTDEDKEWKGGREDMIPRKENYDCYDTSPHYINTLGRYGVLSRIDDFLTAGSTIHLRSILGTLRSSESWKPLSRRIESASRFKYTVARNNTWPIIYRIHWIWRL